MFEWIHRLPILSLICYLPLLGVVPLLFLRGRRALARTATAVLIADFLLAVPLWFEFDRDGPLFQFRESAPWIDAIGVRYELGIDGMALLLVLLTTLLGAV